MTAKRSNRALALLLALPSGAFALGLGDIHLLSTLNAPLDAQIELVDVAPDEQATLQAQIAPRDSFTKQGLDYPNYLANVQVRIVHGADGRQFITLKSNDAITDPFLTVLLEVNWSHGHLLREYTMLLDPPVYAGGQSNAANAPVSAPTAGTGAREGAIARAPESAPTPSPSAPAPSAPAEPVAAPASATPAPAASPQATAEAPAAAAPARSSAGGASAGSTHVVQRGETLSQIASGVAESTSTTGRTRSWMVAIYQDNPRAFDQNMNVLRTGALLRIPDATSALAVSPADALTEIRRQYAAWRGGAAAPPAGAAAQPGRLKLVTPSEGAAANAAPGASSAEVSALKGQVHDLENQLAESKRLLEMKNADLARLQAQLAAKQGAPAAAAAPATAPPPAATTTAPPSAPPAAQTTPAAPPATAVAPPAPPAAPPPEASEQKPPPAAQAAPPETQPAAEKPAAKPVQKPVPAPSGGGLFDTLMAYWYLVLAALVAIVALIVSRTLRSRRAAEFDDSLGRLALAGASAAESGAALPSGPARSAAAAPVEVPPIRPTPAPAPEASFLVEESGSHERPRLAGAAAPAPAPRHVASDETISSETAINLDQGDPLAEADFHMAYGLYDQAADLIRIAISREPGRRDLRLKLLEVFFVWGNKEQFLQTARELAETRSEAAPGEWEKILIMGKQLAPEDPLFSGGGAVTGAAAGGVDLDLEGGQSRVDFDLLGEPVSGEAPQSVDLDIGSAVGEHEGGASESTTNVTDRNAALADGGFLATTGTTRQMTARLRSDTGATGEMEAPTVEQPSIAPPDSTVRQKVETALRQSGGAEQTAELAIDDLGLEVAAVDTVDQPGPAAPASSTPDGPTLVAGLDDRSRRMMDDTHTATIKEQTGISTGAWSFDQNELEAALTQTSLAMPDVSATARLAALKGQGVDVDVGDATSVHAQTVTEIDLDVGAATGSHPANGGGLDLDVGTATVPDTAFAATQRLSSEELALPDLEPVTMSEVGTKLDLARAYMDMGDPDGARNILEEVLTEGSAAQKQEAQRLMESLPG